MSRNSPADLKIACFRSLFRGRTDVYPQRFESRKTGRAGYSPACGNEWEPGLCAKPRIKCSDCPNQRWLAVDDWTIRWHLSGRNHDGKPFVMGVYPMLLDETCFFLAIDLDGAHWREDAAALAAVIDAKGLPLAMERSRSGNGAHFWFFFAEAIPAKLARRLGTHLLTEAMEHRPEVGMRSYDRLFPNQDTLPKGSFGNLIALPLQKAAREVGNSVFLDRDFQAIDDQWTFLGQLCDSEKLLPDKLESLLHSAERENTILPVRLSPEETPEGKPWTWTPSRSAKTITGPLPEHLTLTLSDQIYVPKAALGAPLRNRMLSLAAFQNPEFYKAQARRLPTYSKPRVIACAEDHPEHIALPRGLLDELTDLLAENGIPFTLEDVRETGTPIDLSFQGTLRPEQAQAAEAMLKHETGVLAATTAFGKTVLAAHLIAARGVNTLILVHRRQLMDQWVERLAEFLHLPAKAIGRFGGGRRKLKGTVDVGLIQSFVRKGTVIDAIAKYGQVIVDECHHVSARSFELAISRAKARYLVGLTATVERKDGHHPIICMQCGPVRYRVNAKAQAESRPFSHAVIVRPTNFRSPADPEEDTRLEFQRLCQQLCDDAQRNAMICEDVLFNLKEGRQPMVLTERTGHLDTLNALLQQAGASTVVLRGGLSKKESSAIYTALDAKASKAKRPVILATGRYVGEGFDCPWLDTLMVALPVSWRGTVAQYAGRLHRLHAGKREVRIFDYADLEVPMLARMFDKRCRGYEAVGYSVQLPASALPGWPQSVPLPVDPEWKRDYSGSVKRLIRDGVDTPLASLFVEATRDPGGNPRARSASEAFFLKRLETLEATRGRFLLNHALPLPFNQRGSMEVDFFAEDWQLVIELDGKQHLADESAWRSDRKKDALLQLHGYFVLRFLASDLAKRLDGVLDELLAVTENRRRRESKARTHH